MAICDSLNLNKHFVETSFLQQDTELNVYLDINFIEKRMDLIKNKWTCITVSVETSLSLLSLIVHTFILILDH